jgi:prepilin-type N-terminal cleavage/methylation domain-containing protein
MSRRSSNGRTGWGGFTLIELAIVVTLVGLLAWMALPTRSSLDEIKLRAAARRIAGDLRYAQSMTILRRVRYGVVFDLDQSGYTLYSPKPGAPVPDPSNRGRALGLSFRKPGELQGISIDSVSFDGTNAISFDSFGSPRDAAGRDLSDPGRVVLSYAGMRALVTVSPGTGTVTLE